MRPFLGYQKLCGGLISLDTSIGGKSTDRGVMYEP
jgi:hypothetical protein